MADDNGRARVLKVARWLIIQGTLELLVAVIVGVGWASQQGMFIGEYGGFQGAAFLVIAACALLGGIVKLAAGRRNREFRGRSLGITALWSSLLSVGTCYCFPTAAILLVYGLRVYTDPTVRDLFHD